MRRDISPLAYSGCDHSRDRAFRHCRVTIAPHMRLDTATRRTSMQRDSTDRKERLHETFTAALDLLDAEHREPDRWEEECLSYALGAMACGMYLVAEVELAAFKRPVAERSPEVVAALAAKPARFTKAMLRHGLDYVQQRYGQRQPSMTCRRRSPPASATSSPLSSRRARPSLPLRRRRTAGRRRRDWSCVPSRRSRSGRGRARR